MNDKLTAYR